MDALLLHRWHFLRILCLRLIDVIGLTRGVVVGLLRLIPLPILRSGFLLSSRCRWLVVRLLRLVVGWLLLWWLVVRRLLLL